MDKITDLVNSIVQEHYEYISMCERNSTETEKHIAVLRMRTAELQANREVAEIYFKNQMKERERLFKSASEILDKAIECGDTELAKIAIRIMEVINRKSPFG